MGLWRCQAPECSEDRHGRLIFDFVSDKPVCPKCHRTNTATAPERIIKLECIHYDPPSGDVRGGMRRGKNEWACQPGKPWKGGHATGDATAVTCPKCKATLIARQGVEAMGGEAVVPDEADFEVEVDAAKGVLKEVLKGV